MMDAAMETAQLKLRVKLLESRVDNLKAAIDEVMTYEKQKQKQAQEAGTWSEQTSLYEDDNESEADNEDDHHV